MMKIEERKKLCLFKQLVNHIKFINFVTMYIFWLDRTRAGFIDRKSNKKIKDNVTENR